MHTKSVASNLCIISMCGLALLGTSCNDGSTPPPAEAAVSLTLQDSPTASGDYYCWPSYWVMIGYDAPSSTSQGIPLVDGRDFNEVNCSVKGNGEYAVNASVSGFGVDFHMQGSVQAGGSGTAKVEFFDFDTRVQMTVSDENCIITTDGAYTAEPGAIWASLNCAHIASSEDSHLWCAASGVFVFRNCYK